LAGGLLTGKHKHDGGPVKGTRFDTNRGYLDRYWKETNFRALDELAEIAKQAGKTTTELAFQWLAAQDAVDSIVIGFSRMEHLEENLTAWESELDKSTLEACAKVWDRVKGNVFQYNR
jgi:aryl-alcohol dehydrogenase-like predicted oxidoreductase